MIVPAEVLSQRGSDAGRRLGPPAIQSGHPRSNGGQLEVDVVSRKPGNNLISWVVGDLYELPAARIARHVALEYFSVG